MTAPDPEWIAPEWPAPARVRVISTTRRGGASAPPFDSLNLSASPGDDPGAVAANRARLARAAGLPARPVWMRQVHGARIADLDGLDPATPVIADAAVARTAGPVCAVLTADCLPVAMCDRDASVVGVAHAGWRGLASGVLEATLAALDRPPARVLAWLGPAIGADAYEVGEEVRAAFGRGDARTAAAFRPSAGGRWLLDLAAIARERLERAGVPTVHGAGPCTASCPGRFFSHRRDGPRTGRMATLVWLED